MCDNSREIKIQRLITKAKKLISIVDESIIPKDNLEETRKLYYRLGSAVSVVDKAIQDLEMG